jgi:methylenetetrahydrofolate--tRNA-(uracil-5-)-methyltransferase
MRIVIELPYLLVFLVKSVLMIKPDVTIIGGGLAGSEAAWQIAERGIAVRLYEMRPNVDTGAHVTGSLAELVCSNSLGSNRPDRASGLLKQELRLLGSLLIKCADESAVPAGSALAVDRGLFSSAVTEMISRHPNIEVVRQECQQIPGELTVIASGPLTSNALSQAIVNFSGKESLFFYDAISPIISYESINLDIAFRQSRYRGKELSVNESQSIGDYINCPMGREQYYQFIDALITAERIAIKDFEKEMEEGVQAGFHHFFEGCLPVEILARRGRDALAFGPMRPVGLVDPVTGRRPYAVVQLRQDNLANTLYNMVGFQTNLTFNEQKRVFHMIPGLEQADFIRYGQMHRNTFIFSPGLISPSLQSLKRPDLFFAGQITGVEGYAGNIATGWLAGLNCVRYLKGEELFVLPRTTMLGALCHYVTHASEQDFQPMKANFGILPPLLDSGKKLGKIQKGKLYAERALDSLQDYMRTIKCA